MGMKAALYKEWYEYFLQYNGFFLDQMGLMLTYTQLLCFSIVVLSTLLLSSSL